MSEPMSSGEIEDVLSSIRRLVSEDLRPAARSASAEAADATAPQTAAPRPAADKLLLTPALRVVREEPDAPPATGPEYAGPEADPETKPDRGVEAAGESTFHSVRTGAAAEAVAALGAAMGRDAVQDEAGDETDTRWTEAPFHHVEDACDGGALHPLEAADVWDTLPESAAADVIEAEDWVPEDDPEPTEAELFHQADEAVVLDQPEAGMADGRSWADAAEAEVLRELSEDAAAETVFDRMETVDAVYDEELLRDLVRDIIREELQGALGERITRNVRKLVRAEIARALAVRDFE